MDRVESLQQFEKYLQRRFPDRRTAIDYVSDLRQFMAVSSKVWREMTMQDIDVFVDQQRQQGLKPATIKRRVAALKTFFDFLAEESGDLSWPNPVRFKRHAGKQPRKLPRDLSNEVVLQIWQQIQSSRDRAWFILMWRAGLRVSEVVGMKSDDLLSPADALHPARLRVLGKGQKERIVLLSQDAEAVLLEWLAERPANENIHLFLNDRGRPLTPNGIEWLLRGYASSLGLHVTPHQLRHTFARQLTEAEMPITSLGKLLGHSSVQTTQHYVAGADPHLSQAYQEAMSRLDSNSTMLPPFPDQTSSEWSQLELPPEPAPQLVTDPDWEQWGSHLPSEIRLACIDFVKRRLPTWKPQRRYRRAVAVLGEFRRFFEWQLQHRHIQSPGELHLRDLQAFQEARIAAHKSNETINKPLNYLLSLLQELTDRDQPVDPSVFRLQDLPKPDSLPRYLTETEAQRLETFIRSRLDNPDPIVRLENACFLILAHTGIRASECLDLQVQDIDWQSHRLFIRLGKGLRDRIVYLSDVTCLALKHYLGPTPRHPLAQLLTHSNGNAISYGWLNVHISALGLAAGVHNLTPHRLRHTLATRLLNAGMNITFIQKLLGHEHLDTTLIYARALDTTVEADYRQTMSKIECQHMPLSKTPIPAESWPAPDHHQFINVPNTLDNSV